MNESKIVSIHSPRRSEGRPEFRGTMVSTNQFQSTPPAEARGDFLNGYDTNYPKMFQSTPPAEARGDPECGCGVVTGCSRFNPLPPPKRGETRSSDGTGRF